MKTVRLDKLLSNLGYGSRKEIAAVVRAGYVTLDGVVIKDASVSVSLDAVRAGQVLFDEEVIDPPSPLTVMMNKPAGYTCSHDEIGLLVYDLLPHRWSLRKPILSTAGRLDKESTGQVILTDDGDLLHRIIHPRSHAQKHYRVTLQQPLRGDEASLFATGEFLMNNDVKPLKPAVWVPSSATEGVMVLSEGRYHQIRRMFETIGNFVVGLHRFQTGGLGLGDLPAGEFRILNEGDLASIFS